MQCLLLLIPKYHLKPLNEAAVPQIIERTDLLRQTADICCSREIPCLTCSDEPEGSMAMMVKLNLSLPKDISDDIDFCFKLAKEESVIILPGLAVGLKDWLRITFVADPSSLEEGLGRIKSFCQRYAKQV